MHKREKQKQVFVELVNKQLEPFGVNYDDVSSDPNWYMRYTITPKQEEEFIEWGVELIKRRLNMTRKMAEKEMSWFILQWGLTTNQKEDNKDFSYEKDKIKLKKSKSD